MQDIYIGEDNDIYIKDVRGAEGILEDGEVSIDIKDANGEALSEDSSLTATYQSNGDYKCTVPRELTDLLQESTFDNPKTYYYAWISIENKRGLRRITLFARYHEEKP